MPINCSINFFINTRFAFLFWTLITVYFPYHSPIILLSFSYRSPIVLLLFSYCSPIGDAETIRKRYGIDTETIRNRTEDERMRIGGTREVHLTIIVNFYDNGKTQTNYWGVKMFLSTTTKSDKFMHKKSRILNTLPNGVRLAREKSW